ncbi:beta-galactosidase [Catenovulum adriaticum]|uniref:Beta-galactosidase n=1 Tax=Catenovulum adriaticum TaxID=2984846 RepID=A0ABY7AV90_9ALTE|nr:beta-galactosidase [Catenovulum sp. TS8]WAJ72244.1 beta-galactosidase [Catenovulum sp. TS8]
MKYNQIYSALLFMASLNACVDSEQTESQTSSENSSAETMLLDFERLDSDNKIPTMLKMDQADAKIVKDKQNHKIQIDLNSVDHYVSGFEFKPDTPWNWADMGKFAFALDIENPKSDSIHFYVTVKDTSGQTHNRSVVVSAKSDKTYFIELKGDDLDIETGIRSNPNTWQTDYTPVIWRWGVKNIDLTQVESIVFNVRGVVEDKQIFLDNLRLITPKDVDKAYLAGLVDKFGQNDKVDFVNKIDSTEALRAISAKEQSQLIDRPLAGRSKFSGWKDGPQLEATGYFRTQKYQGKWTLVDPQGYLFFSNGIANVRMANTSTITGYDFDSNYITPRSAGDFTPEDSLGLNTAPKSAWPSRYVSSELRANMFNWLPDYDEPLGKHFGYRREVHTGAVEKGETYSFYRANLARKYQSHDPNVYLKKWRETTVDRMLTWGFTSFGNWVDPSYYQLDRIPYFANGWIIGDFKTITSGNDYWSPLPDPFDPVFKQRALVTAKKIASEVQNSPWCVGIFIDNEKSWGSEGSIQSRYGIAINGLAMNGKTSPTKAEFTQLIKAKYQNVTALNQAWGTQIQSWQAFEKGVKLTQFNANVEKDLSDLSRHYSDQYFAVVRGAVKTHLPNHLYMGVRFADWGMTPEVRASAAEYADVVSYNYYKEVIHKKHWDFLEAIDKPSIIGEFHNGALDSGLLNPGLIHAESQADRGKKYQAYLYSVIDNPYLVGAHWFQYIDSPLTGRAYDGENYNVGFVSVTDIPYQPLVDAAKTVNKQIYQRRFKQNEKK